MENKDVDRVIAITKHFLPQGFDYENLAIDILIESWQNGIKIPARVFIKNRCWDALRRLRCELEANEAAFSTTAHDHKGDFGHIEDIDLMTKLVKGLSVRERKAIWYRYYLDLSIAETGRRLAIGKQKASEILTEAIYKMRQAHDE